MKTWIVLSLFMTLTAWAGTDHPVKCTGGDEKRATTVTLTRDSDGNLMITVVDKIKNFRTFKKSAAVWKTYDGFNGFSYSREYLSSGAGTLKLNSLYKEGGEKFTYGWIRRSGGHVDLACVYK